MPMFLASCSSGSDPEFSSRGVLLNGRPAVCDTICCDGWHITIEGVRYRFLAMPPEHSIDLENETFPLNVRLDWRKAQNESPCTDEIVVTSIRKE